MLYIYSVTKNNLVFSSSYEQTQLREIDDYALQFAMFEMRRDIENSELRKLIFRFDYAYGWFYWIIYSSFGFIISKITKGFVSSEQIIIFASRELTLIIFLATIVIVFLTLKKIDIFKKFYQSGFIYLILLLILFSPGTTGYVVSVKPVILSVFLLYLAIYTLIPELLRKSYRSGFSCRIVASAIFLGLASGTKITIVFTFPIILIMLVVLSKIKSINQLGSILFDFRFILYSSIYVITFLFAISPIFFINPVQTISQVMNIISIFTELSTQGEIDLKKRFQNFIVSSQAISPGIIPLLTVILLLFWKIDSRKRYIYIIIYLIPYSLILILSLLLGNGVEWIVSYSLGISIVIYLSFFLALDFVFYKKNHFRISIFLFFALIIPFNYSNTFSLTKIYPPYNLNHFVNKYNDYEMDGTLNEITLLKARYDETFFVRKIVLQDYETPIIWSNFRPGIRNILIYDDWDLAVKVYSDTPDVVILRQDKNYFEMNGNNSLLGLKKNGSFGQMNCVNDFSGQIYKVYICIRS